jgi:hypothetical protein
MATEIRPLFDRDWEPDLPKTSPAMDLRDWYAGQAMVGLAKVGLWEGAEYVAEKAFKFADAMMAARKDAPRP